jgi:hypothetical protein
VIAVAILNYYPLGAQVMTLVLPLGWFIVVMAAFYVVFSRPHTVPGHQPLAGARPVAPAPGAATAAAAATGFPLATGTGGTEPLADRDTPPAVGARADDATEENAPELASDEAAFGGGGERSVSTEAPETGKSEDTE